jgi:hypothetical protein
LRWSLGGRGVDVICRFVGQFIGLLANLAKLANSMLLYWEKFDFWCKSCKASNILPTLPTLLTFLAALYRYLKYIIKARVL